jgi:hypothetical protein
MGLNQYINPDAYHPEVVAKAAAGEIAALRPDFLILRLGITLRDGNLDDADVAVARLESQGLVGYELFQLTTARMVLAFRRADQAAFQQALIAWLHGRRLYPGNWINSVLQESEFAAWLENVDPADLATPSVVHKPLTDEDRAYVRNLDAARLAAIHENLQWLREMGLTETVGELAKSYSLSAVNRDLQEATISSAHTDHPCIILVFDGDDYVGSFIAH